MPEPREGKKPMSIHAAIMQSLPVSNRPHGDDDGDLSQGLGVTRVGSVMLGMLETLLPTAARNVEEGSLAISDHFATLTDYLRAQEQLPEPINEAITGIVVALQFQDRNTQVMDNAAAMLTQFRHMIDRLANSIETQQGHDAADVNAVAHSVETILSSIRLSDIRNGLIEALIRAEVHTPATVITIGPAKDDDDIELF
jgi:hypothetical protein